MSCTSRPSAIESDSMIRLITVLSFILVYSFQGVLVYGQAPTITPTVAVVSTFATNITIAWNHTRSSTLNTTNCTLCNSNPITQYRVEYGPTSTFNSFTGRIRQSSTVPVPIGTRIGAFLNFTATGLTPRTRYSFIVRAVNSRGQNGPFSFEVTALTLSPGVVLIQVKLHDVSNCLQWREIGPSGKLNSMRQSLARAVNTVCPQCQLNEGAFESSSSVIFLRGAFFMCFPESEHQVTYRTEVIDVSMATAQQTVGALQRWMTSSEIVTITIDSNRYYVNNCSLSISSFDDPECSDFQTPFASQQAQREAAAKTDTSAVVGGVVGAVVGVVFILSVAGVIMVIAMLVFLQKRKYYGYKSLLRHPGNTSSQSSTRTTPGDSGEGEMKNIN